MRAWDFNNDDDDPWKKWREILESFGFKLTNSGVEQSNDPAVQEEHSNMRKAAGQVGKTIEAGYEAQKDVLTWIPGTEVIYDVLEYSNGKLTLEEAIERGGVNALLGITGGNLSKNGIKLLGTTGQNLLNSVENPKLKNLVKDLFRPTAQIGSGSSMDAFRVEQLTGGTVGGKSHHTKLLNYRTALQKVWSNRANLSPSDKQITKQLLQDIQNALSGY